MATEAEGFEMVQGPVENGAEGDKSVLHEQENGKSEQDPGVEESVKFGSHGDESAAEKENGVSDSSAPKDVAEEWPESKEIHSFYFVRLRRYDDPSIKPKIDKLDKEMGEKNLVRIELTDAIKAKRVSHEYFHYGCLAKFVLFLVELKMEDNRRRESHSPLVSFLIIVNLSGNMFALEPLDMGWSMYLTPPGGIRFSRFSSERAELISEIKVLQDHNKQFQIIVDEKIKEIEPLQQALGKLRTSNNAGRGGLCSSEEELNNMIHSLQYRIQHESIPLTEEKQIIREIKELEGTREKVIANAAVRAKVQDSVGKKEVIQDQVKLISGDLDGVKKERQAVRSKIKQLDEALKDIDKDIQSLEAERGAVTQKREKAFESIQQLRRQRDDGNTHFYQSRRIMTKAQDLAANKDINALQELSRMEVEKFMSCWNSDRAFRDDYEKRLLPSLDSRQLSRDGRMRNPDEKPLLEEPKPAENDTLPKSSVKLAKEEAKTSSREALPSQKVQKETKNKGRDLKSQEDTDEYEFENPQKETSVKEPEIDPVKLKEMKREEEIAKAKLALERKKKLAEKAAAKAAKKAQLEAEKKLKGREKKAKKEGDEVAEAAEQENVNDNIVEASAPVKEKVQKESGTRYRSRTKGHEAIPKVILKRRKSNNFWAWVMFSALLVLIMLVLGLNYLS
ncbi:hypothetical protein RIF29_31004 [Crotalaria pallida]|uniref:Proton pump-interactor 1 n=1 Tax=Crotalaria pallida TaxID=3830 RepID=A0AAN9EH78_CROPI